VSEFFQLVTPAAIASSVLFGAMVGGLYGYRLSPGGSLIYPYGLWWVGLAFIVMLTILTLATNLSTTPAYSLGRAVLWTVLCAAIPVGRWLRFRFEEWRLARKVRRER